MQATPLLLLLTAIVCILHATSPIVTPAYDPAFSKHAFYYTLAAFCPADSLEQWDCPSCVLASPSFMLAGTVSSNISGAYGYVGYSPTHHEIVVGFEGSHDIRNWIENLKFFHERYEAIPDAFVEKGFFDYWMTVKTAIIDLVSPLVKQYSTASIIFTGHSLGAAATVLGAVDLSIEGIIPPESVQLISYGTPRVGNEAFVQWADAHLASWRVIHDHDIVPGLPPTIVGYSHTSNAAVYNADFTEFVACTSLSDKACEIEHDKPSQHTCYFRFTTTECGWNSNHTAPMGC